MVCRLVFVKDVAVSSDGAPPRPPLGQTELPTCPVCLERLDEHISGVVTTVRCCFPACTRLAPVSPWSVLIREMGVILFLGMQVCNHRFHNECLQRWGDTSCPVCRYCADASTADSRCSTCGTAQVSGRCTS